MSRRNARRYALQVLYSWEINQFEVSGELETPQVLYGLYGDDDTIFSEEVEGEDLAFARRLIGMVKKHVTELDLCIARHLQHWSIGQISLVDKNILRIAAAEYQYPSDETLDKAIIFDEAVDLAKEFSTGDSYRFVNGILTAIVEEMDVEKSSVSETDTKDESSEAPSAEEINESLSRD